MNTALYNTIEELIDHTDFKKIQKVMKALNWTWHGEKEVPSVDRMKKEVRRLGMHLDEGLSTSISCGGFRLVKLDYDSGEHLSLMFCVTKTERKL